MEASKKKSFVWIALGTLVASAVLAFVLRGRFHPYSVPTGAMAPEIPIGSYVFVDDWAYDRIEDIKYGDVIVFDAPPSATLMQGGASSTYVFRVVGKSGDTIVTSPDGGISRNGKRLARSSQGGKDFERQEKDWYQIFLGGNAESQEIAVPEGHLYVVGDNRPRSFDSRYWGTVSFDRVKGRARVN